MADSKTMEQFQGKPLTDSRKPGQEDFASTTRKAADTKADTDKAAKQPKD